ncbi:amino acid adenylation domain-containing protein [Mycobacterium sp.]|uniref:amino acid adenylation domain-containing protein n=1 Tax=Mycobacterium sp. TaxID=1785 RepID=UPI003BA8AF17
MRENANTVQERRRELLRRRIAESGVAAAEPTNRAQIYAGVRYPLSAGQRRMWFLQAMDADDVTLNVCVAYRLTGHLDEVCLRAAFNDVVARHSILRTVYAVDADGEPYQEFSDDVEVNWRTDDVTHLATEEREQRIETLARNEFGRPFDLTSELPLRARLVRTAENEFVLILVVHHICWDDDSWDVFLGDLNAAYGGRCLESRAPQFVAVEVLDEVAESPATDVKYWADSLRSPPEPPELPGSVAPHPSRQAQRQTRALSNSLFRGIEDFARKHSSTPFMVLLAAFGVLVRRYTGAAEFVISVPVTERRAAAEGAIGYFGNTLLLRIAVGSHATFASLVDEVRDTCLAGFTHQSVGIDRVVREVNPERSGHDGMDQLVKLGFSMRKSANGFRLGGVTVRQLALGAAAAQLPLALNVSHDAEGVFAELEYHSDVLNSALIDRMLSHYVQLLDNALAEPERALATIDMFGTDERDTVLAQSHGELFTAPATTMVAMLEAAAAGCLNAPALASDDAELTYAELHGRANRLARWFVMQGLGPDAVVGLRMTASIEFVVAMFAVLKAGAAYLPIDPAYPDERIEYLIADAHPQIVLGRHELDAAETAASQLSDAALTNCDRLDSLRPEHVAYVIYTSGSTGWPKGVVVPHRAIAEHVEGFIAEWSVSEQDRWLQSASVSFDASLADIFVTLSVGAQLIVPNPDAFGDIGYLADLIGRHGVTVLHVVPSMLSTLLELPPVEQWRQLRRVPVGGEALPGEVADKFGTHFDAELRNHYGPTEAVVCSTHMTVAGSDGARVIPVGQPNRNVYAYVLDRELRPVPADVVGELYLGGAQLARGYLGRPGLTAQRFVADPFNPGMRLYRSGDLFRRNVSGELEFVGRADQQVKIRGFRIELGEIESVVATHPAVRHCVVVADDTEVGPTLTAYVVPVVGESTQSCSTQQQLDEIRLHAASTLPEFMVPSAFVIIPEIPLMVSGKLDRQALPAPAPVAAAGHREPATPTERRVCAIFAELFGCQHVHAEDSFFGLGGHSLLAARLVAQIRAQLGVALTVRAVFDTPTPAGLAARLVEYFRVEFDVELDEIDIEDTTDDATLGLPFSQSGRPELAAAIRPDLLPLSYSQLAAWFQYRMEGAHDGFNMPLALRFVGQLANGALVAALNDVVARHEALRTNFAEQEGVPYQFVSPTLEIELPVRKVAIEHLEETLVELRRYVFTPESGPLIRANLVELASDTHVLLIVVHHLVGDHVSLGVLFEDLITAYRARVAGDAPRWATPTLQFADYALWQRDAFDTPSEWGQAELAYWRTALAALPDEISVCPDRRRPPVLGKKPGPVVNFTVPAARRLALTQLAEQDGATEFMIYQAAFAVVLSKLSGGTDIPVGSPVASRVDPTTANLIGLFANLVVLRNDLSGDPSLRTIIARSRDTVLDAFAHQELPIERLVEALNPPRSRSRNPLFQNMIHFRGQDWALTPRDLTGTGETTVVPLQTDFDIALLDLALGLNVTPDSELDVRIIASADLYEPATVERIADAFRTALDAFSATPDLPVSALELLPGVDLEAPRGPLPANDTELSTSVMRGSIETQRILIALLEELLDTTGIDPDDNFFALGGDSIISIKWSAQAAEQGLALVPAMVFEHMTIGELAAAVDAAADQLPAESDSAADQDYAPMSASGLTADALAELTASWQRQS